MSSLMDFHFLRPAWLLALLLLPLALWWWSGRHRPTNAWRAYVNPALLVRLQTHSGAPQPQQYRLPALVYLLAILALAGPAWEKLPTPVLKSDAATVFLLDLSPSMLAQDLRPSRIVRARQKLTDALQLTRTGLKALVVYGGEAHLVTPLTDDARTILSLVPSLDPGIMPLSGSNIEAALQLALNTLREGQVRQGRLVLITDGISPDALAESRALLSQSPYPLHIISIGDETGAPIPVAQGFAKDPAGNIVMASNDRTLLRQLAGAGQVAELAIDNRDIAFLDSDSSPDAAGGRQVARDFDQWQDRGYWLAWLLVPLCLLMFRRNYLFSLAPLLLAGSLLPGDAQAMDWQALWLNGDQRGQQALQQGDAEGAAQAFRDPRWKAQAHYQAGQYPEAAQLLQQITGQDNASAHDWYNRANAEAQAGQLEQAIESYQQALARAPDMADAQYNKSVVEQLREQQKNQQQNQQQGQQNQQNQQNQQDQQNSQTSQDSQPGSGQQDDKQQQGQPADQQNAAGQPAASQQQEPQQGQDKPQETAQPPSAGQDQSERAADEGSQAPNQQPDTQQPDTQGTAAAPDEQPNEQPADAAGQDAFARLSPEEQQAVEQWLRRVPDDPAALLREKFRYQYHQRQQAIRDDQWQAPENNAHQRW